MGKKGKWAIGIIAVAAIGSVLGMSAAKRSNKAVEVRMETVQKRDLVASVTASGQVRPQTKVDVASDVSGKIIKLAVKEGQMVKAGQFLLQIDPSQPQANVDRAEATIASAKAQLAQAQANLEQAQRSYDRSATMKKQNPTLIADEAVEQLRTAVDVDKAVVEAGKHAVDQANASLNDAKSALEKTTMTLDQVVVTGTPALRGSRWNRVRPPCRAPSTRTRRRCSRSVTCLCWRPA